MEFIYLRIEEEKMKDTPKNILFKDLNFSSDIKIKYNSGEIKIERNKYSNFYELKNILDICAIVGKNGAGKSKLLSLIPLYSIMSNSLNSEVDFIVGFKENNKIIIITNNIDIKCLDKNVKIEKFNKKAKLYFKNNAIIYASNSFSWDDYFDNSNKEYNYYNISFDEYIREKQKRERISNVLYDEHYKDSRFARSYIDERKNNQRIKNISFLKNNKLLNIESISVTLDYLYTRKSFFDDNNNLRMYDKSVKNMTKLEKELYKIGNNIISSKKVDEKERVKVFFYIRIIDMLFDEITNKINVPEIQNGIFKTIDSKIKIIIEDNSILSINKYLKSFFDFLRDYKFPNKYNSLIKRCYPKSVTSEDKVLYINCYKETITRDFNRIADKYEILLEYLENLFKTEILKMYNVGFFIHNSPFYNEIPYIFVTKKKFSKLNKLLKHIDDNFNNNFLNIYYRESSAGLNARIDLYSNLTSAIQEIQKKKDISTILILLDEPDLYFHPEWKRKFLNDFTNFISEFENIKFQIILTTNEPYILSDLRSSSIIALEEGYSETSKTFCSNIYELLKNQYFMNDVMGELAIKKIENIIVKINNLNSKTNIDKIEYEINEIADELIKKKLLEMLHNNMKNKDKVSND